MNGTCEKPLQLDGVNLFYGNDEKDHAYENDVYDRISKKIKPYIKYIMDNDNNVKIELILKKLDSMEKNRCAY